MSEAEPVEELQPDVTVQATEPGQGKSFAGQIPIVDEFKPLDPEKKATCHEKGDIIRSEKHEYLVQKILGKGGFGTVYKVKNLKTDSTYALKTEEDAIESKMQRLKVEHVVLELLSETPHFISLIDYGAALSYKFIVMPLVGRSLESIKKDIMKDENFSPSTVIKVAIQTLNAVQGLHEAGFIHRDIKPANFAVGLHEDYEKIFMLDFGICKYYLDEAGAVRLPREKVHFIGTIRYCSYRSHFQKEAARRDDLESWIFMVIEMLNPRFLPWSSDEKVEIPDKKMNLLRGQVDAANDGLPVGLQNCLTYVSNLDYYDRPDYFYLRQCLGNCKKEKEFKIEFDEQMDWAARECSVKHKKQVKPGTTTTGVYYGYGVK